MSYPATLALPLVFDMRQTKHSDCGSLPCTIRPKETEDLTFIHVKGKIIYCSYMPNFFVRFSTSIIFHILEISSPGPPVGLMYLSKLRLVLFFPRMQGERVDAYTS